MTGKMTFIADCVERGGMVTTEVDLQNVTVLDAIILSHKFCEAIHIGKEELLLYLSEYDRLSEAAKEATLAVSINERAVKKAKEGLTDG